MVLDVVGNAKQINLILDVSDELDKLASSLGLDKGFAPHCLHMAHSLLVEQKLEHSGVLYAVIRRDVSNWLHLGIVQAVILHAVYDFLVLVNQVRKVFSEFVEIVILLADLLLSGLVAHQLELTHLLVDLNESFVVAFSRAFDIPAGVETIVIMVEVVLLNLALLQAALR